MPYLSRDEEVLVDAELLDEEEELPEEVLPLLRVASLASVLAPTTPSAVRPFFFWKFMTAASVREPKWPLMLPE